MFLIYTSYLLISIFIILFFNQKVFSLIIQKIYIIHKKYIHIYTENILK